MKKILNFLIIFLLTFCFKINAKEMYDSNMIKIFKNVRCLVCEGQSINDSNSDFSENVKKVIEKKIKNGLTEEEIYRFLTEKYGDWILFKPKINLKSMFLWVFPYLIFIFGGVYLIFFVKKNKI